MVVRHYRENEKCRLIKQQPRKPPAPSCLLLSRIQESQALAVLAALAGAPHPGGRVSLWARPRPHLKRRFPLGVALGDRCESKGH